MTSTNSFLNSCYPWRDPLWGANEKVAFLERLSLDSGFLKIWNETQSFKDLEDAGFFMDHLNSQQIESFEIPENLSFPLTPIPSVLDYSHLPKDEPWVVLLTTGSFAPFHEGHEQMMQKAEQKALEMGWPVLGCYLSPSHDAYVSQKDNGRAAWFNICWRVDFMRSFLQKSTVEKSTSWWVDPWEGVVPSGPVNFTVVCNRLKAYLEFHLKHEIKVIYVFGEDNADFYKAFKPEHSIRVSRPGYSAKSDGVIVVDSLINQSSTKVRDTWEFDFKRSESGAYFFRNEGEWALEPWLGVVDKKVLISSWDVFTKDVVSIVKESFAKSKVSPSYFGVLSLDRQVDTLSGWIKEEPDALFINMDECTNHVGGFPLDISRHFRRDGHQSKPLCISMRPGKTLSLPDTKFKTKVILIDDDSASGGSIAKAKELLKENGLEVDEVRLLLENDLINFRKKLFDVVDFRDFLPGAKSSGLVIDDGAGVFRAPYWSPEVSLCTRASLPFGSSFQARRSFALATRRFYLSIGQQEPEIVEKVLRVFQ